MKSDPSRDLTDLPRGFWVLGCRLGRFLWRSLGGSRIGGEELLFSIRGVKNEYGLPIQSRILMVYYVVCRFGV